MNHLLHNQNHQVQQVTASVAYSPYVIDQSDGRERTFDLYSKLLNERIVMVTGAVHDQMANAICAAILHLNQVDSEKDIIMYVNSPGGSIYAGLAIIDMMNHVSNDIITIGTGICASMGAAILTSGAKGKRRVSPQGTVMIHQASSGAQGHVADMRISQRETERLNTHMAKLLASATGKDLDVILNDIDRDLYLDAEQSVEYGLVDLIN